jgi:hypothetical protein
MRRSPALLIGALFVVALAPRAFAQSETVTGKLIDMACYSLNKDETGNAHRRGSAIICAQACAREGFPVGLLTTAGKVYEVRGGLAADINAKLVPHMSHTVTITGDVSEKDGVTVITASDLKMVSR